MASNATPSIETVISAIGGKPSRDGLSVIISMGNAGYIRATPDYVILDGAEVPAVALNAEGCRGGKGRMLSTLREKARAAGLEIA